MSEVSKKLARVGANGLSIGRSGAGVWLAQRLGSTPRAERDWGLTGAVASWVASDKADGWLGRRAPESRLGGWLDQIADKAFVLPPMIQLARQDEIDSYHAWVKAGRDIGVTALRSVVHVNGGSTAAENIGKYKTVAEMGGLLVASSPLAEKYPNLANRVFEVATALNIASGVYYASQYGAAAIEAFTEKISVREEAET